MVRHYKQDFELSCLYNIYLRVKKPCIRKTGLSISKKVPFETCHEVPDVECVTVLKNKPEIECTPEPYEECNDVAKDIPYLEPGEECEEIVFDECLEVKIKFLQKLYSKFSPVS